MSITLRNIKGSPLTHEEMDENFSALTGSLDAGDGLTGGGPRSGSIEFAVDATVARTGSNTFTGDQLVQGNVEITGTLTAQQYVVSSSVTFLTQSFSSGSTISEISRFSSSLTIKQYSIILQ